MNTIFGKRRLSIGVVVVALIAVAAAGGFSTLHAAGDGTATAETVASVTLTPGTATTDLYPGRSGDVALSIANNNPYRAYIGSLALDTSRGTNGFSVSGGQPGCDPAVVSYTAQSNGGGGWFVPAGSTLDLDLTDAVDLGTGAASACQGATVIVYLLAAP